MTKIYQKAEKKANDTMKDANLTEQQKNDIQPVKAYALIAYNTLKDEISPRVSIGRFELIEWASDKQDALQVAREAKFEELRTMAYKEWAKLCTKYPTLASIAKYATMINFLTRGKSALDQKMLDRWYAGIEMYLDHEDKQKNIDVALGRIEIYLNRPESMLQYDGMKIIGWKDVAPPPEKK